MPADLLALLASPPKPARRGPAYARFCRARRDANLALLEWLRGRPDPDDVADEVAGSISVLRQLVRLALAGGVR
jgi:hypothetical protein